MHFDLEHGLAERDVVVIAEEMPFANPHKEYHCERCKDQPLIAGK